MSTACHVPDVRVARRPASRPVRAARGPGLCSVDGTTLEVRMLCRREYFTAARNYRSVQVRTAQSKEPKPCASPLSMRALTMVNASRRHRLYAQTVAIVAFADRSASGSQEG